MNDLTSAAVLIEISRFVTNFSVNKRSFRNLFDYVSLTAGRLLLVKSYREWVAESERRCEEMVVVFSTMSGDDVTQLLVGLSRRVDLLDD